MDRQYLGRMVGISTTTGTFDPTHPLITHMSESGRSKLRELVGANPDTPLPQAETWRNRYGVGSRPARVEPGQGGATSGDTEWKGKAKELAAELEKQTDSGKTNISDLARAIDMPSDYLSHNVGISKRPTNVDPNHPLLSNMSESGRLNLETLLDTRDNLDWPQRAKRFENELAWQMGLEKRSLAAVTRAAGLSQSYLNNCSSISTSDGTFDPTHPLLRHMSEGGRNMLQQFLTESTPNRRGYLLFRAGASRSGSLPDQQGEPPEQGSTRGEPHVIDTPGVSFNDVYGGDTASEARWSSTPSGQRPGGAQTYGPSPSFFDSLPRTWDAGGTPETSPHPSAAGLSTHGVPRHSPSSVQQSRQPDPANTFPSTGATNVTATQQSASAAPGLLTDRELGILEDGLQTDGEHLRSVSDAALYIDSSVDVERVRPYVSVVGNGETGELRLTEFARRELEARDQRARTKRSRHRFIHYPTTSLLQHVDVEAKQLRIEEGKSDQPPARR
ncbi:MAG TPA: hypothetical protein VFP68_04250 [Burkholderiaceae bacterium]|nr:hypothetical protein [Burkholderiaceae bacterium]